MTSFLKKAGIGAVLAATVLTAAAPAQAQYYGGYRHYDRGGNAGPAIVAGIAGLAIGAAIASNRNDRYYDRRYDYRGYYGPRYYDYPRYRGYYYDDYPRCYVERRFDPYNGYPIRVRVCR